SFLFWVFRAGSRFAGNQFPLRGFRLDQKEIGSFQCQRWLRPVPYLDLQIAIVVLGIGDSGQLDFLLSAEIEDIGVVLEYKPTPRFRTSCNFNTAFKILALGLQD